MNPQDEKVEAFFNLRSDVNRLSDAVLCYITMFNGDTADFNAIAEFEGPFFGYFQTVLGESLAIRVGKLLDTRNDVLSLYYFTNAYASGNGKSKCLRMLSEIKKKAESSIHLRHNWVAHKNRDTALGKVDITEVDVMEVQHIAMMMDEFLNELSGNVFPDGIKGSDGSSVGYAAGDHTKKFLRSLLDKIRKSNELLKRN